MRMKPDIEVNIDYNEECMLNIKVVLRPHLIDALQYLSSNYELCIFTAGEQKYADAILD